jgi:hypothetical protein
MIGINPRTVRYEDEDGDGYAANVSQKSCTNPGPTRHLEADLIATTGDCNDVLSASGALMYPTNLEVCDFLDNDCDQEVDE